MAAIIAKKYVRPLPRKHSAIETLHTVTALKTLAGNIVIQNKSASVKKVTLAVSGIAAATEDMILAGASRAAEAPFRSTIRRSVGSGLTAKLVSADYRTYSNDGGVTWSEPVANTYYGFTNEGGYAFKLVIVAENQISLYPSSSTTTHGAYATNPYTLSVGITGIAVLLQRYPDLFVQGVTLNSTSVMVFWPVTTTAVNRFYSATGWTTDSARTLVNTASGHGTRLGPVMPIANATASYSGALNLESSTNNYGYYTTNTDTAATNASVTSPVVTDATTVVMTVLGDTYGLAITANNKALVVSRKPTTTASPTISALSALPGSIAWTDILAVMEMNGVNWVIVTKSGAMYYSGTSALSWNTLTPTAVVKADSNVGSGEYQAADSSVADYFPTLGTSYLNTAWFRLNGFHVGGAGYNIQEQVVDTLALETHDLLAGEVLELSGRIFAASTVIKVAVYEDELDGGGIDVALYGLES